MARRKRSAWALAFAFAALSAVLHLTHDGAVLRGALATAFGLDLWRERYLHPGQAALLSSVKTAPASANGLCVTIASLSGREHPSAAGDPPRGR